MNIRDGNANDGTHDDGDAALRLSLRGLRRDMRPEHDLWPVIAERIAATTQTPAKNQRRSTPAYRRPAWFALAASLIVALGIGWQLRPAHDAVVSTDPTAQLLTREADAMAREYDGALRELGASTRPPAASQQAALHEIDRSAAQVRIALSHDPDARFLLDRLQSLYARRLALTQRFVALT
ncbi:MAG: hypothetical protein ABJA62_07195 [Luteimonas sp.]